MVKSLAYALKECGAIKFGDFTLASGKKSKFYVDIKKASMNPELLKLIACRVSKIIKNHSINADYIGGVALGGVPIAVSVSLETGKPLLMIRKEAIQALRDEGLIIRHVITVVDREEGASESLASSDVELIPLVRMSELLQK